MQYQLEANQDVKPDIGQLAAEDNIPIDPSTGLPQFPPFGLESLGSRAFIKYRLVKLLKSDLWHHLIENRLLLKFMVGRRDCVDGMVLILRRALHRRIRFRRVDSFNVTSRRSNVKD